MDLVVYTSKVNELLKYANILATDACARGTTNASASVTDVKATVTSVVLAQAATLNISGLLHAINEELRKELPAPHYAVNDVLRIAFTNESPYRLSYGTVISHYETVLVLHIPNGGNVFPTNARVSFHWKNGCEYAYQTSDKHDVRYATITE